MAVAGKIFSTRGLILFGLMGLTVRIPPPGQAGGGIQLRYAHAGAALLGINDSLLSPLTSTGEKENGNCWPGVVFFLLLPQVVAISHLSIASTSGAALTVIRLP